MPCYRNCGGIWRFMGDEKKHAHEYSLIEICIFIEHTHVYTHTQTHIK